MIQQSCHNVHSTEDMVPVYPPDVQGDLRMLLQIKDLFVLAYKQLEDYNQLIQEQNNIITKTLIDERLNVLEAELISLRQEETQLRKKLQFHMVRNEHLISHLEVLGLTSVSTVSARKIALLDNTSLRHRAILKKYGNEDKFAPHNPVAEILGLQDELLQKVKPILYFYRDLFYLQLHFVIVLSQICSACLPLLLQHIPLVERVFFWNERPEFIVLRQTSEISDRLREIYTRVQQVLCVLSECVNYLKEQLQKKRDLLIMFNLYLDWQEKRKNELLQRIHEMQCDIDHLEEENDRMIGVIVKVDPAFVGSEEFREIADLSIIHNFLSFSSLHQKGTAAACFKDEHERPDVRANVLVNRKPPRYCFHEHKGHHSEQNEYDKHEKYENQKNSLEKIPLKDKLMTRTGNIISTILKTNTDLTGSWKGEFVADFDSNEMVDVHEIPPSPNVIEGELVGEFDYDNHDDNPIINNNNMTNIRWRQFQRENQNANCSITEYRKKSRKRSTGKRIENQKYKNKKNSKEISNLSTTAESYNKKMSNFNTFIYPAFDNRILSNQMKKDTLNNLGDFDVNLTKIQASQLLTTSESPSNNCN